MSQTQIWGVRGVGGGVVDSPVSVTDVNDKIIVANLFQIWSALTGLQELAEGLKTMWDGEIKMIY